MISPIVEFAAPLATVPLLFAAKAIDLPFLTSFCIGILATACTFNLLAAISMKYKCVYLIVGFYSMRSAFERVQKQTTEFSFMGVMIILFITNSLSILRHFWKRYDL